MRTFTRKIKSQFQSSHGTMLKEPLTQSISPPSEEETIYRYRKQRGVNLGSWFVLERWIANTPFKSAHAPGQSDLDVARGSSARQTLEGHWDNWIVEEDWKWLSQRGINTVRIPIGYYHICGADSSVLDHTTFQDFGPVFSGAWYRITRAIEIANEYGIGVLIDLHAAPGKQNNDAHAGTSDPPTFFSDKRSRKHTIHVLCTLLRHLRDFTLHHQPKALPNLIGIELLNEPHPTSDSDLQSWYSAALKEIRAVDPHMPLYLGDCWRTDQYANYIERLPPSLSKSSLVVLDHHLYRCFTASDISTKATDHARSLADQNGSILKTFERVSKKLGCARAGLIVGEWSGALNPGSLTGTPGEQNEYISAQLALYEQHCAGWYFWTYKKEQGGDTGWSFRDSVEGGVFPSFVGLKVKNRHRGGNHDEMRKNRVRGELKDKKLGEHITYWSQYPGGRYEHWRFGDGFVNGWDNAYMFFESHSSSNMSVPELGFMGAWAHRTTEDHGSSYWEYEHGFFQGVDAATNDFREAFCY